MELIKEHWTKEDGREFQAYLKTFENSSSIEWTRKIINTNMPLLAIKAPEITKIINGIKKGNFKEFLDLNLNKYYENSCINGKLIMMLKDFAEIKKYLIIYADMVDNWASCDLLAFRTIKEKELDNYYKLSLEFIKSDKPFVRRIGMDILFRFVDYKVELVFDALNKFENEEEYYVNMVNAWLFAECFTKKREETIEFLKAHKLNKFTINKGIQKCRDSYRISQEDKDMLLKYKK